MNLLVRVAMELGLQPKGQDVLHTLHFVRLLQLTTDACVACKSLLCGLCYKASGCSAALHSASANMVMLVAGGRVACL